MVSRTSNSTARMAALGVAVRRNPSKYRDYIWKCSFFIVFATTKNRKEDKSRVPTQNFLEGNEKCQRNAIDSCNCCWNSHDDCAVLFLCSSLACAEWHWLLFRHSERGTIETFNYSMYAVGVRCTRYTDELNSHEALFGLMLFQFARFGADHDCYTCTLHKYWHSKSANRIPRPTYLLLFRRKLVLSFAVSSSCFTVNIACSFSSHKWSVLSR